MMGNVIEGGVIGTAPAPYPLTATHLSATTVSPKTPISTAATAETVVDSSVDDGELCESTESSKARVQAKSVRSKSLESLTIPSDQSQSSTLKHPDATKKSNSMSSEVLDKPEEFQLTIREFLNKFKLSISLGGKQNDGQSAEPPKEDKTTENELEKPDDTSPTEGQKCPDSVSASLASVSVESYHTASESTEESTSEDLKNKNLSRNPSVFSLQPDVENEIARISPNVVPENADIASGFKPKSDLLPTDDSTIVRTRSGRQLLGRAFSCEGSGIRCVGGNYPSPNEDSDTSESDKDRSNPQMDLAESINELYIAESDEEDRTLVVDEGVTKGAREGSDDDDIGKCCEGDTFPDDRIKVKDQDRVNLARKSSSSSGNEACRRSADKTGLVVEKVLGQCLVTNLTDSQDSQDEEEVTEKPFGVDALNVDPSSAASEQVLENLISSSSGQPSFDDPDLTETSVFVFPDGKPGSDQAERVREILEEVDFEEDSIEKLPKSPLVRSGSRIIDKKTKTIRGRPKSCHSSTFQTGIKEEIFTEMGFAQDRHDSGREEQSDLVVTPKPRVPFKSMQVQSLVEMPEEEGEVNFEKSRTYASKSVSCRPKSFPSAGFFEGTDSFDLNLNPETVKKMPDILNKSCESGYVSGSYSQSPPLRSLTATPSLTMPSGLTQPKLSSQTLQSAEVDHFVITCRNESTRKIDEHANLEKFKAVLRREPQGYGMRTGGNKPVLILSVVEGSVAARHGLKARDVIFMLNGTNVSQYDHESVLSFFKASRSHLEIVVLRQVDHKGEAQKSIGNQIEYLKTHPALMACLLLDLTLQNKQNSLFFSMAAYLLRQKDACDSNFQRWSYEIFSTFLDQHAPLKLQHGLEVPSISGLLSSDEESIRRSYDSVDQFLQPVIKKQLSDYLKNKGLVHEFELTNMDHLKQMKYIEKVLWKSFETLSSEEKDDKKQALAASMATFFHLVGFSSIRGGNLLESFPSFVSNKIPSKLKKSKGHLFRTEYITNMSPCGVCKQPTWNLGTTVYKCSSCSFHIHSYCLFKLTEACNFKRKTNSFAPFYVEDPNSSFDLSKSYAGLFRSRSCQLSCKSAFIGDPDLDIPLDLPHLKDVIPHEDLKKLKNKELKFQEIVNELFHTEKLHLRSLKIMKMLYERPMRAEPTISNITNLLFPNLDELIRVHDQLNVEFEKCKEEQRVVTRIGGLLVSLLSGLRGDQLKRASAIFCKDQSYSLFALRKNLRKEKLTQIIQEAALNPYSGRLSLKDFLPKEMQRITKYPLLIDSLVNNSPANSEEHTKLVEASKLSRNILRYVDTQVRDCENGRKLMDLQLRLDARQLENSTDPNVIPYRKLNLTRKKLIMDGELAWKYKRAGGSKTQNLHVVLCEDILLLLVKQEERLVLKCHTTTIEDHVYVYYPVLQLSGLLAKDAGRDKCAFFIVDRNSPQVYHLAAKNKELRNRWFNTLTETVNNLARSAPVAVSTVLPKISPKSVFPSSASANQIHDKSSERSLVENDRHMGSSTSEFKGGVMTSQPCPRRDSAPSLVGSIKRKLPMAPSRSFDVGMTVEDERR